MRFLITAFFALLSACGQLPTDTAFNYRCESGLSMRVIYPTAETAVVEYEGRLLPMEIAISASGARYVGEGLEWWTKGSGEGATAMLLRHRQDGRSGEVIRQCRQIRDGI